MWAELISYVLLPFVLWQIAKILWVRYVEGSKDGECELPLPPGSYGLPLIGETLELAWKKFDFYRERSARYGHVYKTHVLGSPTVRVWGKDNLRKVLRSEDVLVTSQAPTSVKSLFGEGAIALSQSKLHTIRRQAASKAFSPSVIEGHISEARRITRRALQNWEDNGHIMGVAECRSLAFKMAAQLLLKADCTEPEMEDMIDAVTVMENNLFCLPIDLPGFAYHKALKARARLLAHLRRIQKTNETAGVADDSVTNQLRSVSGEVCWTKDDHLDSTVEALFASMQGISSAMCSCLIQLFTHPEIQEKLRTERKELDIRGDSDLTSATLSHATYLQNFLKEIFRFAQPIGGGFRKVIKTFELEGYQIPKGWTVLYSIRDNHESEEHFNCARQFNPDRWNENHTACAADDYRFLPFGGVGTRSCTGEKFAKMVLEVFVTELVTLRWNLPLNHQPPMRYLPLMLPTDGLPISFVEREKSDTRLTSDNSNMAAAVGVVKSAVGFHDSVVKERDIVEG